jgi:hypothetical protein
LPGHATRLQPADLRVDPSVTRTRTAVVTVAMPSKAPADAELDYKKKLKKTRMEATTGGIFSQTKKKRRSTREMLKHGGGKTNKAARVNAASAATAVANTQKNIGVLAAKLKLLEKLLARHEAAGKRDEAAETQGQIDAVKTEIRLLEVDIKALQQGPQVNAMEDE